MLLVAIFVVCSSNWGKAALTVPLSGPCSRILRNDAAMKFGNYRIRNSLCHMPRFSKEKFL